MTLADGTALSPALGIGAFAEKTLVAAGQCTKVDPRGPARGRRPARLRRDGRHRRGDQHRRRRPGRHASRSSAAAASATPPSPAPAWPAPRKIIAVDIDDRKLDVGQGASAPPTRSTPRETDAVEAIQELTGGFGADVVIEAVGRPETYKQAFYARDLAGTVVLVGVPTPEMKLELPLLDVFGRGGSLKSSWYGDCLPSRDFPMLIDLYLQGRLRLDALRHRDHRPRRRRGGVRTRCTAATSCARWWCCDGRGASNDVVTSGTFSLDGGTWDVDNNVWLVGDDARGASSSTPRTTPTPSPRPVGDRRLTRDRAAPTPTTTTSTPPPTLADGTGAPILLHPRRPLLWEQTYPDRSPDADWPTGRVLTVGGRRR